MKRLYFAFMLVLAVFNTGKAQYVTIPDPTFVSWLQSNGYAACMNGNQLDTTCGAVLGATVMRCYALPIRDLTGVQYFKNLNTLDCSNDSLYVIPSLPTSLIEFHCQSNNLSSLPVLPGNLYQLWCSWNRIATLPLLPNSLGQLVCYQNQLSALPVLPDSLELLNCGGNHITTLPALPAGLLWFECDDNPVTVIPALPANLGYLSCAYGYQLTGLPALPNSLTDLYCSGNQIGSLPALPAGLLFLQCKSNQLTSLPVLPGSLETLLCDGNQITSIPYLPNGVYDFECSYNNLTSLPPLPINLQTLLCSYNQITNLPPLPAGINYLECAGNQLSNLPSLPDSLYYLFCDNNPNLHCLPELKRVVYLVFDSLAITCLPNYGIVTNSTPALSSIPLCGIYNPNGCRPFWNISGECFYDQNNNCSFDSIDVGTNYVKTQLYDNTGNLVQQTFTGGEGFYSFDSVAYGSYSVRVDTSNLPFVVSCPGSGSYADTLSAIDSLRYNNNFAFKCRTQGFDIGVQSVLNNYVTPRPNAVFTLNTIAGDMSELYGAHCASGVSGQVQIITGGQLTYLGPATGALPPTVLGNTLTWPIADFGAVNDFTAFNAMFKIDSLAVPGDLICFNVFVTPTGGDYDPGNNTLAYCFPVVNALDPNEKEVYPQLLDTPGEWLTYTVRFQNTGTAPAVNVRITDTLDTNFDPSTFQLLNYSAKNLTQIFGNVVVFNFPNINLPDSATSDSASRGYVQYKVKLRDNTPFQNQTRNTAYIFFDLNSPVVTNTTVNIIYGSNLGFADLTADAFATLYPNPAHNYTTVSVSDNLTGSQLELTDAVGRVILSRQITGNKFNLPTGNLSRGVYLVRVGEGMVKKLVVE